MSTSEAFDGEENPPSQDNPARGSPDDETGCNTCKILNKKLRASREWNRFYQMKLENTDKLLHIIADYEREKQHNVELQLAYDQRTRESSYIREQMANLLLEVEPLREKLRIQEKRLEEELKRRERAENQEQGLLFSIEQQKHQITSMREKVDTNLIEILEKKLAAARSEIKRLKSIIDDKSCEISELKDFNADRRLHYERNNKKALWSLKLAREYGLLLHEQGCLPGVLTSAAWCRLQPLLEVGESILESQYQAFRRKQEKKFKKNSVEMAALPSLESWLDDFDVGLGDELFEEEEDNMVGNSRKKVLAKEAKQLEELIQDISDDEIGSKGRDKMYDQDKQKTQLQSEGLARIRLSSLKQELEQNVDDPINPKRTSCAKAPYEVAKEEFAEEKGLHYEFENNNLVRRGRNTKEQKQLPKVSSVLYPEEDESSDNNDNSEVQNEHIFKRKFVGKDRLLASKPDFEDHTNVYKASCNSASCENPCGKTKMKLDIGNDNKDFSDDFNLNQGGDNTKTCNVGELPLDCKNDSTNLSGQVDSGEDIIRQILNDMKPHDKLDCLDNSFCLQDSEDSLLSEERHRDRAGRIVNKSQERHTDTYEDDDIIGPISDSSDDTLHDVPKTLVSQVSQGFSVADTTEDKVDSMLEDLGITDSDVSDEEETLQTDKSTMLLQRFRNNFQSSQSFSVDIGDPQGNTSSSSSVSVEDNLRKDSSMSKDKGLGDAEYLVGIKSERSGELASLTNVINLSDDDPGILSGRDQFCEQNYAESNLRCNDKSSNNSNIISNTESSHSKPNKSSGGIDGLQDTNLTNNSVNDENRLTKYNGLSRHKVSEAVESVVSSINESSQNSVSITNEICLSEGVPSILSERDNFKEQNDVESDPVSKDNDCSNDNIIDQIVDTGNICSKPNKPRLQKLRHLYNVVNDSAEVDEHELVTAISVTRVMTKKEEHQKLKSLAEVNTFETEKVKLTETLETKRHMVDCKKASSSIDSMENIKFADEKLLKQNRKSKAKKKNILFKGKGGAIHICHESFCLRSCKNIVEGESEHQVDEGSKEILNRHVQLAKDGAHPEHDAGPMPSKGDSGSYTDEERESDTKFMFKESCRNNIEGAGILYEDQESKIMPASSEEHSGSSIENTDFANEDQVGCKEVRVPHMNSEIKDTSVVDVDLHVVSSSFPDQGNRQSVTKQQQEQQQPLSSSASKNGRTLLENPVVDSPQNFDSSVVIVSKEESDFYAGDKQQKLKVYKDMIMMNIQDKPRGEPSSLGTQDNDTSSTEVENVDRQRIWQSNNSSLTTKEKVKVDQDEKKREKTSRTSNLLIESHYFAEGSNIDDERKINGVDVLKKRIMNSVNMRETTMIEWVRPENDSSDKDAHDRRMHRDRTCTKFGNEVEDEVCSFSKDNIKASISSTNANFSENDSKKDFTNQIMQSRNDEVLCTLDEKDSGDSSCCDSTKVEPAEITDHEIIEDEKIRNKNVEYISQSSENTNGHINAHHPEQTCCFTVKKQQNISASPKKRKLKPARLVTDILCSDESLMTAKMNKGESCSDNKRTPRMCRISVSKATVDETGHVDPSFVDTYDTSGCVSETEDACQMRVHRRSSRRIAAMEKKKLLNQEKILQKFQAYRKKSDQLCGENLDSQNIEDSPMIMNNKEKENKQSSVYKESFIQDIKDRTDTLIISTTEESSETASKGSREMKPLNFVSNQPARILFNWGAKLQVHARVHVKNSIKFFQKGKLKSVAADLYGNQTHNVFSLENRKRRAQKRIKVSVGKVDVLRPKETTVDDISLDIFDSAEQGDCRSVKTDNTDCRNMRRDINVCSRMKRESTERNHESMKRESRKMNNSPVERIAQRRFIKQPRLTKRKDMDRRSLPQAIDELRKRVTRSQKSVELCTSKRKASQRSLFGSESSSNKNSSSCLEESSPVYKGLKQRNRRKKEVQEDSRSSRGRGLKSSTTNVELSRSINRKSESSCDRSSSPDLSSSSQDSYRKGRSTQPKTISNRFVRKLSVSTHGSSLSQKKTLTQPVLDETDVCTKQNSLGGKNHIDSSDSDNSSGAQERIKRCKGKHRSCFVSSETDDSESETSNVLTLKGKRRTLVIKKKFRATANSCSETEPKSMMERKTQSFVSDNDVRLKSEHYSADSLHGVKELDFRHWKSSSMCLESEPEPSSDEETIRSKKCLRSNKAKQVKVISSDTKSDFVVPRKESAFEIASRLSASHMKMQENKRTAILLDTAPQSASKRQRKKSLSKTPEKCHEGQALKVSEKYEGQVPKTPMYSQEKEKIESFLPEFDSSDTEDNEDKLKIENQYDSQCEKVLTMNESTSQNRGLGSDSEETNDAVKEESSYSKYETQIVSHPGLVSSLARLGTLDRPRVKPKPVMKKTLPKAHVPASSGFVESLFCRRIKDAKWNISNDNTPEGVRSTNHSTDTSFDPPLGKLDDVEGNLGPNVNINHPGSSTLQVIPGLPSLGYSTAKMNVSSESIVSLPNLYGSVKNIPDTTQSQLPNLYGSLKHVPDASCSLIQEELGEESTAPSLPLEASHSMKKFEVMETVPQKQGSCSQPYQQPEKNINNVAPLEIKVKNVLEKSMQDQRACVHQLHIQSSDKQQMDSEIASVQEGEDCNYSEILEELSTCRIKSRVWNTCISKLCSSLTAAQLLPLTRNCIECILRADPNEHREMMTGLPPALYKLFQVICVLELQLELPPLYLRKLILRIIHDLICKPSVNLRPHSLACLTAWYTASVSIPDESGVQQWELARTFIVDLVLHHPGTVHLALLSAASTSKKIFLRMVKYREGTGLEKVLLWVAYYGVWTGCVSVREKLVDWLMKCIAVRKPPPEDPTTLAHNLLTQLKGTSDAALSYNLVTSIVVLACWLGRLWIQNHLLPTITEVNTKYREHNRKSGTEDQDETKNMEESERQPDELISQITLLLGHLDKILKTRHEAKSNDRDTETKQDDVIVELNEALLKLLRLPPNASETTQ